MLFSHKITKNIDEFIKQEGEEVMRHQEHLEGIVSIISHLIIQYFDKKFSVHKQLVRQVLSLFFKNYVLFSESKCDLMLQAQIRVAYSIMVSKYEERQFKPAKKKKPKYGEDSDNSDDDFVLDKSVQCSTANMEDICENLDIVKISGLFMMLLSNSYISQKSPEIKKMT